MLIHGPWPSLIKQRQHTAPKSVVSRDEGLVASLLRNPWGPQPVTGAKMARGRLAARSAACYWVDESGASGLASAVSGPLAAYPLSCLTTYLSKLNKGTTITRPVLHLMEKHVELVGLRAVGRWAA